MAACPLAGRAGASLSLARRAASFRGVDMCHHQNIRKQLWWERCNDCGAVRAGSSWTGVTTCLAEGFGTLESERLVKGDVDLLNAAEAWVKLSPWTAMIALCRSCDEYHAGGHHGPLPGQGS